jgi:hypothetical protein
MVSLNKLWSSISFLWDEPFSYVARVEDALPPPPPIPKIGCIAREILNDLSLENHDKWSFSGSHNGIAKMNGKEYHLIWGFYEIGKKYFSHFSHVKISEIEINPLSITEQKMICHALSDIDFKQRQKSILEEEKRDKEILNKLFPACIPATDGIHYQS